MVIMNCFFNELSFSASTTSFESILPNLKQLSKIRDLTQQYSHVFYIHRNGLYNSTICNKPFRKALNETLSPEQKRKFFSMLDRSSPALPEDSAIPDDCCFKLFGKDIANSSLAECSYRLYMGEESLTYSLVCQKYSASPLTIDIVYADIQTSINITNIIGISELESEYEKHEPEIQSWDDILNRSSRLPHVHIEQSARESLQREPYEASLGKTVWDRLQAIEKMASSSGCTYHKLIEKYCHGDNALFSEESSSRINDLGNKLHFKVNGKKQLCSFHGKVRHRVFRIHMDKKPEPGKNCYIVYIGRKIL